MSDTVVLGIVTGVLTFLGVLFNGIMAYLLARLNKKADTAVVEVLAVKETLATTTAEQSKVAAVQSEKLNHVIQLTNGMKSELVDEVRKASFAQGEKSEKEKTDYQQPNINLGKTTGLAGQITKIEKKVDAVKDTADEIKEAVVKEGTK